MTHSGHWRGMTDPDPKPLTAEELAELRSWHHKDNKPAICLVCSLLATIDAQAETIAVQGEQITNGFTINEQLREDIAARDETIRELRELMREGGYDRLIARNDELRAALEAICDVQSNPGEHVLGGETEAFHTSAACPMHDVYEIASAALAAAEGGSDA